MLKKMREGSAYFIKGVMLVVAITFIGTIFVVWGVKSTPGDLALAEAVIDSLPKPKPKRSGPFDEAQW